MGLLLLATTFPAHAAPPTEREIDSLIRDAMKIWNVPGVAVAVVRDDRVVYLGGHGVRSVGKKDPVTPDTLFAISSNSKAFTTSVLALLVSEKKLHWDDPVRDHLPWFQLGDRLASRAVTLRDLVCHRTGLGSHVLLSYRSPWTPEEAIRRAGRLPLDRPFRTTLQYQNTLFAAAGFAAARATGQSWTDLIRKRLLDPLGMKRTRLSIGELRGVEDVASPHKRDQIGDFVVMPRYQSDHPDPAVSIHSSARDLAVWLRFHLNRGSHDGKQIVPPRHLAVTHTPQIPLRLSPSQKALFPDSLMHSYAMGWVVHDENGEKILAHGGAIDGFRTHLVFVPGKKLGIAVLTNLDRTRCPLALAQVLLDRFLDWPRRDRHALHLASERQLHSVAVEDHKKRMASRRFGTKPSRELSAYVGEYEHPAYGKVRISLRQGRLRWRWNAEEAPMEHFHYDTFVAFNDLAGDPDLVFSLDAKGRVSEVKITGRFQVEFRRLSPRSDSRSQLR